MTAQDHGRQVVVWDVPPTIERGQAFRARVGVKCEHACQAHAWRVEVRDDSGRTVATASLGAEPWPGTAALYHAELTLTAPETVGLHGWRAVSPAEASAPDADSAATRETAARHGATGNVPAVHSASDASRSDGATNVARSDSAATEASTPAAGHLEASADFNVRVVPAPECRLTVVAIDHERQTPVAGAKVVVHPYRTATDARGVAEIELPKGPYRLFVSGRAYIPFRNDGELTADATVRAELDLDLGPSDAEMWS